MKQLQTAACLGALCLALTGTVAQMPVTASAVTAAVSGTSVTADGLEYADYGTNVEITGYSGSGGNLVIPSKIGSALVTKICYGAFTGCDTLTAVTLPDSLMCVEQGAFGSCKNLKTLTIPESYMTIEDGAFAECTNLREINFPEIMLDIGGYAFEDTAWQAERRAESPLIIVNGLVIDGRACEGEVYLSTYDVKGIASNAFRACGVTDVTIPPYVTKIGAYAFAQNSLKRVDLGMGVQTLEEGAFFECVELSELYLSPYLQTIGEAAFECCYALPSLALPPSVSFIGMHAFASCRSMQEITICNPDCEIIEGMGTISNVDAVNRYFDGVIYGYAGSTAEEYANANGCKFTEIRDVPVGMSYQVRADHVEIVEFTGNAEDIQIPAYLHGLPVTVIQNSAFRLCDSIETVYVPETVEEIGFGAFGECAALRKITIANPNCQIYQYGSTVSNWMDENYDYYFSGTVCGYSGSTAQEYADAYGYTFETLGETTLGGVCGKNLTWEYDSVTRSLHIYGYGDMAWDSDYTPWNSVSQDIRSVYLPDGLTGIAESAFYYCMSLTEIKIPDTVKSIGTGAFGSCISLKEIVIPNSVTSLGEFAFDYCVELERAVIPGSIETLEPYVFGNCWALHDVQISDGVKKIRYFAFMWSDALENVVIPPSVTEIEEGAFATLNLKDVTVLNPACVFADSPSVFCNLPEGEPSGFPEYAEYDGIIRGYAGSTAQAYAEKYGYRFVPLDAAADRGDLDGDMQVTSADAQVALTAYLEGMLGKDTGLTPQQIAAADIDGDGIVTAADAQYILLYYLRNTVAKIPTTWAELMNG